jgi:hypothetical protein
MKLCNMTLEVLKNFSDIGPKLIVNKDNCGLLSHATDDDNLFAFYTLPEEEKNIPQFGIYDMKALISVMSNLISDPDFNIIFEEKFMLLKTKNSAVKYFYSDMSLLPDSPKLTNVTIQPLWSFILKKADLQKMMKMSDVMGLQHIQIEIINKNVTGIVKTIGNETSNVFKAILGKNIDVKDSPAITWKISSWKMMKGYDYQVSLIPVGEKKVTRFEIIGEDNKKIDSLVYYLAIQNL